MPGKTALILTAACGIVGTAALMLYFTAPFWLMPLPPLNATVEQVMTFGHNYHTIILWDTWLQQIGSFLSVLFALSLVHLSGASAKLAGKLTLLVSGVILTLSLAEGTFALAALQAGGNGHPQAALTCLDLTSVFIHIFLLAPSLFLVLGAALWNTPLLPRAFPFAALVLGILFQVLGVAGLFYEAAVRIVIFVLIFQNLWTLAASVTLLLRHPYKLQAVSR
jgi:hypothetical protein